MNNAMKKIERVSVTDSVVESIRMLIAGEEFFIGDKLPTESEFCDKLGVGRSTVREAFRVLQAMGLVELRPGKGAFVRHKTMDGQETIRQWFSDNKTKVDELMELRMGIEPLAVKLAIARGSAKQLDQIKRIHQEFCKAVEENDVVKMATIDESFHDAIMEASNNLLLKKTGKLLADALMEYRTRSFAVTENMTHAMIPHQRILDAIFAKNEKEAISAMLDHLEISLKDMNSVTEHDLRQN
jgi:GntR family transcriptional regulator, transcriptional repressor for pyruvate dehydrogenase complex